MGNSRDIVLVNKIKEGDRRAFDVLFQKYAPSLINQLKNSNQISSDSAEDIILESFLDVYKSIIEGIYKEKGLFSSYVYTIAHRRFLKEYKKKKEFSTCEEINNVPDLDTDKTMYLIAAEKALESLSELCRDLIYYKNYHNFKDEEILVNFPELKNLSNVKNRRNKCMTKLRELAALNLKIITV